MSGTDSSQAADWREGRRIRAWELKQEGWKQRHIAQALGVSAGAVSQWLKRGREGGVEGLRRRPPPWRTASLEGRPTCQAARVASPRRTGLRLPRRCVDLREGGHDDLRGVRCQVPSSARKPSAQEANVDFAKTDTPSRPAGRGSHKTLEGRALAQT